MTNTTVTVTLLSDLHIGTGTKLLSGIDWYAHRNGYTYMGHDQTIMDVVLERAASDGQDEIEVINTITGLKLGDLLDAGWLEPADFHPESNLFRYRLAGQPVTNEIREQIKSVYGKPYLPGSSLKGALRTVLATVAAAQLKPSLQRNDLGRSRTWAAQPVEARLFGIGGARVDANRDFGRAIQIGDSAEVDASVLRLRRAHIYPTASHTQRGRSRGLDIDLETVAKGTEFTLTMHTSDELWTDRGTPFDERRRAELNHWPQRAKWLAQLAHHGREYARQLLIQEVTYFQSRRDVPAVHAFYDELATRFTQLKKNQFMVPIGWGGGWHTKTLNEYIRQNSGQFDEIVRTYRLNPTGTYTTGDPFPKSRHLLRLANERLGEPLGWVLISTEQLES
ncbi:MAG: type III-A CRISPR-associated RAMP protein Csm5 [Caldilineaceae bacterium]